MSDASETNNECKLTEELLRKSEKKFAAVFHAAPVILAISRPQGGEIIDVNEALLTTCGYRREEVLGRTSRDLCIWENPDDRDEVVRSLLEQGPVRDLEIKFRDKVGRAIVGLLSAELVEIDGEEFMLSLVKDITERKRAETEIEILNARLQERAAELEKTNQELAAFNYMVSHDLGNPLNNVGIACQAIGVLCGDKLEVECREYLALANKGVKRMSQLIAALLRLSQSTHCDLRRQKVDITEMARTVAAALRLTGPGRLAKFNIEEGMTCMGDPQLMRVVLENLFDNAWKFSGEQQQALIEFGMTTAEEETVYYIRDNGAGFDMEHAGKLFAPFKKLPNAVELAGNGIGLATVERIIKRHGGKVWAVGEPSKGATFYFTLPE